MFELGSSFPVGIDVLLPKLFWPTMRKNCSSDREKQVEQLESILEKNIGI